jgi:hypothetical protein
MQITHVDGSCHFLRRRVKNVSRSTHMLMVVCKRSPGLPPSDDERRFIDNWEQDDSLTISESSSVTLASSPVVTVVEVHAEDEAQEEQTLCEGIEELEEEKLPEDEQSEHGNAKYKIKMEVST